MGKLQHQPRPTLACWTPPTFSPMHSSCSSVGKIFPCVILLSIYIYLYSFTFLKVCGREDEFALLLELGHDIQVSNEIKFLSKLWLFFPSGISTWLFGFSYVVGIHSLWYLLIVQVGENLLPIRDKVLTIIFRLLLGASKPLAGLEWSALWPIGLER